MTENIKKIAIFFSLLSLSLAVIFSLIDRYQKAEEARFDWQSVSAIVRARGYSAAYDELRKKLAAHPKDALLHYYQARLCYELGRGDEALEAADKAIALGYAQEISHLLKSLIYGRLFGDYRMQSALASKALSYDPTYDFAYVVRAEAEYALGEYKACSRDAESYLHMAPKERDGYEYSLLCLTEAGEYQRAETVGLKLLSMFPKDHAAFWRMGRLYAAQGLHKRAINKFSAAISLSGGRPRYYLDRAASCAFEHDYYCEAWDYYSATAWREVSDYASYYYLLGSAMHRIGELDYASEAAENGLKLSTASAQLYGLRGRLRAEAGKTSGAREDLRRMYRLSPALRHEAESLLSRLDERGEE